MTTLPFDTTCDPPVNAPAENSVPAVLIRVVTAEVPSTKNAPCNVPAPVIVNDTAELVALAPLAAADQAGVPRAANVGAFVDPASSQLPWEAIVSKIRGAAVVVTVPPVSVVIVNPDAPILNTSVVPVVPVKHVHVPCTAVMFVPVPVTAAMIAVSPTVRPWDAAVASVTVAPVYEVSDEIVVAKFVQLTELINPMNGPT